MVYAAAPSNELTNSDIFIKSSNGSGSALPLYRSPANDIDPVLSPDGRRWYYLDMGWRDLMLAVEYDGEQHRVNPTQFAYDIQRSEVLDELGWTRIRVVKENRQADVLRRLERAWQSKLRGDRKVS